MIEDKSKQPNSDAYKTNRSRQRPQTEDKPDISELNPSVYVPKSCEIHPNETYCMYCFDDDKYYCPCCLSLERHNQEHTIFHIEQLNSSIIQQLFKANQKLKSYSDKIEQEYQDKADEQLTKLTEQRDNQLSFLRKFIDNLEGRYNELIDGLQRTKDKLPEEISELLNQQEKIKDVLKDISFNTDEKNAENKKSEEELQKQTNSVTDEIYKTLKKCRKTNNILGCCMSNIDFINDECCVSFEIDNFMELLRKRDPKNEIIISPKYKVNFFEWYLKVFPWGEGEAKDKFLSAYIILDHCGKNDEYVYEYRLELVNYKGKIEDVKVNPNSNTNAVNEEENQMIKNFKLNFGWGKINLCSLKRIEKDGYLSDRGSIVIRCYLQAKTFNKEVKFYNDSVDGKDV